MPYLLVHHKVADFSKWKLAYDAHSPARQKAGLKEASATQYRRSKRGDPFI